MPFIRRVLAVGADFYFYFFRFPQHWSNLARRDTLWNKGCCARYFARVAGAEARGVSEFGIGIGYSSAQ